MEQRPLVLIFAGALSGMAAVWNQKISTAVFFIVVILIGSGIFIVKKKTFWPFLVGFFVGLCMLFIKAQDIHKDFKRAANQKTAILQATVCQVAKTEKSTAFLLKKKGLEGKIMLYYTGDLKVMPGDKIVTTTQLQVWEKQTNPGQFSSQNYYFSKEIYYRAYTKEIKVLSHATGGTLFWQHIIRMFIEQKIQKQYHGEAAALVRGMLLGDKSDLGKDVVDDFKQSGLIHLLAVSGLHISLAGRSLYRLLKRIGIGFFCSSVVGFAVALSYAILTGGSVSSIRAVLMLGVYFLSQIFGQSYDFFSSAAFAGIVILLWHPLAFLDLGFLLSFCAVFVIGWIQEKEQRKKKGWMRQIMERVSFPIKIQIGMLPIVLYLQYETPVFSFLANAIAVPAASIAFTIALAFVWAPACFLHRVAEILFEVILWLSRQEYGMITTGHVPFLWVLIFYLVFYGCIEKKFLRPMYAALMVSGMWVIIGIVLLPKNSLAFLDVGQGDCTAIRANGGMIFIDGGSSSVKNIGRYRMLPYLRYEGFQKVKIAIITHMDEDHYSGILELIEMKRVCYLGLPEVKKDGTYKKIERAAKKAGTKIFYLSKDRKLLADRISLSVLHPQKGSDLEKNAASLVFQGMVFGKKVLITGDVEKEGEEELQKEGLKPVDVLKVAHHGSKNATKEDFLKITYPKIAVISCGKNNRYGHPHKDVIQRLLQYQVQIKRTDQEGAIIFR